MNAYELDLLRILSLSPSCDYHCLPSRQAPVSLPDQSLAKRRTVVVDGGASKAKMFPTVLPFPPTQTHHHLHYPTNETLHRSPYDVNDSTFPARNDPSRSFFNLSGARLQLPHPVQRLDTHDAAGSSSNSSVAGEHALRRKTPNGTLAAGYDGTLGDITLQPASKHILVSPLESGQFLANQGLPTDTWQQPVLDPATSKHMNFPPVFKNDGTNALPTGELVQGANGTSWIRPVNYPPGIDSVLNQSLPLQAPQRFLLHNSANVPTVLPATLQTCVGPTASAGTGPFGPYWPDGVYVPYRPAAFRDSRYGPPNPAGQAFYDLNQSAFSKPHIPLSGPGESGFLWGQPQPGVPTPDPLSKTHFPPRHADQLPYARVNRSASSYPLNSLNNDPVSWNGHPSGGREFQAPGPTVAVNLEFKEKILSWAHGVYVDLLATIHQARRSSMSNSSTDAQNHRFLKPSIYPKPPRQPGLDFSQNSIHEVSRHNSYPSSQYDLQRQKLGLSTNPGMNGSRLHLTQSNAHNRRPSSNRFPQHNGGSDVPARDTGRLPGTPFSRFSGSLFNESSPVANAVSALEMLSHLCMESHWEWIDGMLLGGCLAYGLGDYHKAMRWYSRIIARDST